MLGFIVGVRLKDRVRVGVRGMNESDAFDLRNLLLKFTTKRL